MFFFCLVLYLQNGTTEEVKKIVSTLNDGKVPSADVVGMIISFIISIICLELLFGITVLFATWMFIDCLYNKLRRLHLFHFLKENLKWQIVVRVTRVLEWRLGLLTTRPAINCKNAIVEPLDGSLFISGSVKLACMLVFHVTMASILLNQQGSYNCSIKVYAFFLYLYLLMLK